MTLSSSILDYITLEVNRKRPKQDILDSLVRDLYYLEKGDRDGDVSVSGLVFLSEFFPQWTSGS